MTHQSSALRAPGCFILTLLAGCSCLTSEEAVTFGDAGRHYAVGNYPDALSMYQRLAPSLEGKGCEEAGLARLRQASCLIRLGRYAEAEEALEKTSPEAFDPADRRELHFVRAASLVEQGRAAEWKLLSGRAQSSVEADRSREVAAAFYRQAAETLRPLTESAPEDIDAALARGVALLRLGIVDRDSQFLRLASDTFIACERRDPDDERARFYLGLSILYGPGRGSLTESSGKLLVEALQKDQEGNGDFHVAYFDLFLYLRPFVTPAALEKAFETRPAIAGRARELVELLEEYADSGRALDSDDRGSLEEIRAYLTAYRRWEDDRDEAERRLQLTRERLKEPRIGVVDKYKVAMQLVGGVATPFQSTSEYQQVRSEVQGEYISVLMDFARKLLEIGVLELSRQYVETVLPLVERPWITEPGPIRTEASTLASRIEAYRSFATAQARTRELLEENKVDEARATFARYKSGVEGTPEIVFVAHKIKEHDEELRQPEVIAKINADIREGRLDDASRAARENGVEGFGAFALRNRAEEHYRAGRYSECLEALRGIQPAARTPQDMLREATCYYRTGEYAAACTVLSRSALEDTSFFDGRDYVMAGSAFIEYARTARVDAERISRYRRAREFLEDAAPDDVAAGAALKECYGSLYRLLREHPGRTPLEVADILENLVARDPADIAARRDLAFLLYESGIAANSSFQRSNTCRRAYTLLAALERDGQLELSDSQEETYNTLVACYGEFLPLATGNRWVYGVSGGRTRVVSVEGRTEAGHFEVEIDSGRSRSREVWQKTPSLFTRFSTDPSGMMARSFPIRLLDATRQASWSYPVRDVRYDAVIVATGVTCKTPAGEFEKCIKVRLTNSRTDDEFLYYFAPDVGEVKMEGPNIGYELREVELRGSSPALTLLSPWGR